MAASKIPHFHNTAGHRRVAIGTKEFQCVGATPPFDHPHVFLDMGDESEIVCPYCSTLYVHDAKLSEGASEPEGCVFELEEA